MLQVVPWGTPRPACESIRGRSRIVAEYASCGNDRTESLLVDAHGLIFVHASGGA